MTRVDRAGERWIYAGKDCGKNEASRGSSWAAGESAEPGQKLGPTEPVGTIGAGGGGPKQSKQGPWDRSKHQQQMGWGPPGWVGGMGKE